MQPRSASASVFQPVLGGNRGQAVPLSYQQAMYLDGEKDRTVGYRLVNGDGQVTNTFAGLRLEGELDDVYLQRTAEALSCRHDALRTAFVGSGSERMQHITAPRAVGIEHVDLSATSAAAREREALDAATEVALRPFDLASGQLLRVCVIRLSRVEHVVVIVLPHLVSDSVTMQIVLREFLTLYLHLSNGRPSPLADVPVHYADFVLWQRQWVQGEIRPQIGRYFDGRLAGARNVALPEDEAHDGGATGGEAETLFRLDDRLCRSLHARCLERKVTPFVTLLGAYAALLSRWSGQDDVLVTAPFAGRPDAATYQVVGMFSNLCPLRIDLSADPSLDQLLEAVDPIVAEAIRFRCVPYSVLAAIASERGQQLPRFGAGTNAVPEGAKVLPRGVEGLMGRLTRIAPYVIDIDPAIAERRVRSDLSLWFGFSAAGGISGRLIHQRGRFQPRTMARFATDFAAILECVVAEPRTRVSQLRLQLCAPALALA